MFHLESTFTFSRRNAKHATSIISLALEMILNNISPSLKLRNQAFIISIILSSWQSFKLFKYWFSCLIDNMNFVRSSLVWLVTFNFYNPLSKGSKCVDINAFAKKNGWAFVVRLRNKNNEFVKTWSRDASWFIKKSMFN